MSACVPFDRLLQTIKITMPGVTDQMLNVIIFNVVDEFLRRTSAWRYFNEIALAEDRVDYDLNIPADSAVVRIIGVSHNGIPLPQAGTVGGGTSASSVGFISADQTFSDGDAEFAPVLTGVEGGVMAWAVYRPDFITVTSPPDESQRQYPMAVVAALTISRSCLEEDCGDWALPEWLYDTYFQDWLDGTLSRLAMMPAKPWTSKELAVYHGKRFRNFMAMRKQEAQRGFAYGKQTWNFPRGTR